MSPSQATTSKKGVVIGVNLSRDTYDALVKRVPRGKRERSRIIDLLLQKYLSGAIVLNHTY